MRVDSCCLSLTVFKEFLGNLREQRISQNILILLLPLGHLCFQLLKLRLD